MNTTIRLSMAALTALFSIPAVAQAPIAGTWLATFERNVRNEDGVISADTGKARIVFEVRGDSVFGTWTVVSPVQTPPVPPRRLRGTQANGRVRVAAEPVEAVMNENGNETKVRMVATYDFVVQGNALNGTAELTSGAMPPMSRPFSAVRERP